MAPRFDTPREIVRPGTQWIVPASFDEERARKAAFDRATLGPTSPADAGVRVSIVSTTRMWVPFWRTEMKIQGWKVDVYEPEGLHGDAWRRQTKGLRVDGIDQLGTLSVCARRGFRGELFGSRVRIQAASCLPVALDGSGEGAAMLGTAPRVDADVDWPEAEEWAREAARGSATGVDTVLSRTDAQTRAMQFVWVPVQWVDYRYAGEANPSGDDSFFVAIAEHDGCILHESRPSRVRAVLSRLRGLLTFDKRALDGFVLPRRKGSEEPGDPR